MTNVKSRYYGGDVRHTSIVGSQKLCEGRMGRHVRGQALVEMVIAVALSGFFVVLLSGMLSQTLVVSAASQNQLIAANACEVLIENAREISFYEYDQLISSGNISSGSQFQYPVNLTGTGDLPLPYVRSIPVQLNMTDPTDVFGAVNPLNGSVNTVAAWTNGSGNFFRGQAYETVTALSVGGLPAYRIDIAVRYNSGTSTGSTKQVIRTAFVFKNGLVYK